jgi:serine phosphatase RsbU (regulator of sigma subunit)
MTHQELLDPVASLLDRVPVFATLSAADRAALAASLQRATAPAGQVLMREGEHGDHFYILLDGEIEIIKALGTPDERIIATRRSGEFVGEMSLLNNDGLRTASVRTASEVLLLALTRREFDALIHRHPLLAYELLRILSTRLRVSNDAIITDLREKNARLAQAYAALHAAQAQIIEQETLLRELRLAREIQESMLPPSLPRVAGFDLGARMVPARIVGGDFYDLIPLNPTTLGVAVGDVSGKGMPAALFMAIASSLLRAEVTRGTPPEEALQLLNQQLIARNAQNMFLTLLYGVLRLDTREFLFVRAGHELPLLWDANGTRLPIDLQLGLPLGMLPRPALDVRSLTIPPGGTLLLYTDGATEAGDLATSGLLGADRLFELACAHTGTAQSLCDALVDDVAAFHGDAPQADDITLLALRSLDAQLHFRSANLANLRELRPI